MMSGADPLVLLKQMIPEDAADSIPEDVDKCSLWKVKRIEISEFSSVT